MKQQAPTVDDNQTYWKYLVGVGCSVVVSGVVGIALALTSESSISIQILLSAIGIFAFLSPQLAFFATLLFLPFSFRFIVPNRNFEVQTPTEPLLGMLVFITFLQLVFVSFVHSSQISKNKEKTEKDTFPFKWPILLFILIHLASIINSPDIISSVKGATRASVYILSCFLTFRLINDKTDLGRLAIVVFPPAVLAVIWTVVVLIYNLDAWQWTSAYSRSPFTNYTAYGQFTVIFLLMTLSRLLIDRSAYDRVIWLALLIVFTCGLLMCFSRGVWLASLVSIGFLLLNMQQHSDLGPKLAFAGVTTGILLTLLILPGTSNLIQERVFTMFDLKFASNRSRLLRWGQAVLMFVENPIFGNGYGAFAMIYEENPSLSGLYKAQFQLGAHSEHLRILAEMGLLGMLAWLNVLFSFFRLGLSAMQRVRDNFFRSLIIGLVTIELSMVLLFFFNDLPEGDVLSVPFWVIYGLLPSIIRQSNQVENK